MWKDSNSSNILEKASVLPVISQLDSSTYAVLFFFPFPSTTVDPSVFLGFPLPQPSSSIASCFPQSEIILPEFWATAPVSDSFSMSPTACFSDNQPLPQSGVVPPDFPWVAFVPWESEGLMALVLIEGKLRPNEKHEGHGSP